jgi:hypothetical protein
MSSSINADVYNVSGDGGCMYYAITKSIQKQYPNFYNKDNEYMKFERKPGNNDAKADKIAIEKLNCQKTKLCTYASDYVIFKQLVRLKDSVLLGALLNELNRYDDIYHNISTVDYDTYKKYIRTYTDYITLPNYNVWGDGFILIIISLYLGLEIFMFNLVGDQYKATACTSQYFTEGRDRKQIAIFHEGSYCIQNPIRFGSLAGYKSQK